MVMVAALLYWGSYKSILLHRRAKENRWVLPSLHSKLLHVTLGFYLGTALRQEDDAVPSVCIYAKPRLVSVRSDVCAASDTASSR